MLLRVEVVLQSRPCKEGSWVQSSYSQSERYLRIDNFKWMVARFLFLLLNFFLVSRCIKCEDAERLRLEKENYLLSARLLMQQW